MMDMKQQDQQRQHLSEAAAIIDDFAGVLRRAAMQPTPEQCREWYDRAAAFLATVRGEG